MPQRVTARWFSDVGAKPRILKCSLENRFMQMVPGVFHPLPDPQNDWLPEIPIALTNVKKFCTGKKVVKSSIGFRSHCIELSRSRLRISFIMRTIPIVVSPECFYRGSKSGLT